MKTVKAVDLIRDIALKDFRWKQAEKILIAHGYLPSLYRPKWKDSLRKANRPVPKDEVKGDYYYYEEYDHFYFLDKELSIEDSYHLLQAFEELFEVTFFSFDNQHPIDNGEIFYPLPALVLVLEPKQ